MGSSPSKPVRYIEINEKKSSSSSAALTSLTADLSTLKVTPRQPASSDGSLILSSLKDWERAAVKVCISLLPVDIYCNNSYLQDKTVCLARTILLQTPLPTSLLLRPQIQTTPHIFNTLLPFSPTPITSQNSSGRCWLFASTNLLRYTPIQALSLPSFQFSQNYLFFYDKLEKANFFLENIIELVGVENKGWDDRTVQFVLQAPVNDGGQWDMVVNILETYGIVPRSVFEESYTSGMSSPFNKVLTSRLRGYAAELGRMAQAAPASPGALRARKEEMMQEVWRMITGVLGVPPLPDEPFKWEYVDTSGKAHVWQGTPKDFYRKFTSQKFPVRMFLL